MFDVEAPRISEVSVAAIRLSTSMPVVALRRRTRNPRGDGNVKHGPRPSARPTLTAVSDGSVARQRI
jgi:hypothetical protein